jgi:hypothetical protein
LNSDLNNHPTLFDAFTIAVHRFGPAERKPCRTAFQFKPDVVKAVRVESMLEKIEGRSRDEACKCIDQFVRSNQSDS